MVTKTMPEGLRSLPCLPRLKCEPIRTRPATNLLICLSWQQQMEIPLLIQQQEDMFLLLQSPDTKPNRMLEKSEHLLLHASSAFNRADLLQHGGQQGQVQRLDEVMIKTCVFAEHPVM